MFVEAYPWPEDAVWWKARCMLARSRGADLMRPGETRSHSPHDKSMLDKGVMSSPLCWGHQALQRGQSAPTSFPSLCMRGILVLETQELFLEALAVITNRGLHHPGTSVARGVD